MRTPVRLARGWWVILGCGIAAYAWAFAPEDLGSTVGVVTSVAALLAAAPITLASVLAHEYGHAIVAGWAGAKPKRITVSAFGAHTEIPGHLKPASSLAISIAGPLTNLAIAAVVGFAAAQLSGVPAGVARFAVWINLVLVIVNLLPAVRVDGGQALVALGTLVTGRRFWGHLLAALACVGCAGTLVAWAVGKAPRVPMTETRPNAWILWGGAVVMLFSALAHVATSSDEPHKSAASDAQTEPGHQS